MTDELFEKYKRDRDRVAYERLVQSQRPLVTSICRRFLRDPNDVDDAVQETFLKLAVHINSIGGSIHSWLTATAQTTSIDVIRQAIRERERKNGLAHEGMRQVGKLAEHEAMRLRLPEALQVLEPAARELIFARFVGKTPLRVLAGQRKISVPTASRLVRAAVRHLAQVLREMGATTASQQAVVECLGGSSAAVEHDARDTGGMRFAPDWRSDELTPFGSISIVKPLAGLARPIRIGALVSYHSTTRILRTNKRPDIWQQVQTTAALPQVGLQLVAVVEPGTVHRGIVECTVRDHGLVGGLIEADDLDALRTLDVLLIGVNFAMSAPIARAINLAVRGGMGLLKEYWTGDNEGWNHDQNLAELMLADSSIYSYHMPRQCGLPLGATALGEHPLLPGMSVGTRMTVSGCGPAYHVKPDARVLIAKDYSVPPDVHGVPDLGHVPMPCFVVGQLGRGRVVVNNLWPPRGPGIVPVFMYDLIQHLSSNQDEYYLRMLRWLTHSELRP